MAQSAKHLVLAQVMISRLKSSSPTSSSGLTARTLEPASHSGVPSLSAPPLVHALSLSKMNKHRKKGVLNGFSLDK